ncbi:MAG: response regulator [Magnetococcales bacterium]|nr:response regulator [Magnetococcales bacterium]
MRKRADRPSILIVDDTPENLDALKMALMDDYMIRPAINGTLALRLASMEPQPDLILLDIMMPDMDGYEVCRRLKRNPETQDIPVIFVTAKSDPSDEIEGLEIGAVDYITKPISAPIVKARIKTQLSLYRFNLDLEEKSRRLYEINERLTDSMEQLSASEERFRSLVQTIPDIVYKIDSEGCFTFLNKSIERLGFHQSDLIGRHFTEIIHSADIREASLDKVIERIGKGTHNPEQKVFDERRTGLRMTMGLEIRLKSKNGPGNEVYEVRNVSDSSVNVEVNSTGLYGDIGNETSNRTRQYIGTVGVIRDVTDRLKIQQAFEDERKLLRELISSVPLPIFFIDSKGYHVFSNTEFQSFAQYDPEALETRPFVELFDTVTSAPFARQLTRFIDDGSMERMHEEIHIQSKQGTTHIVDLILSKYLAQNQTQPAVIGVLVDVTEQRTFTSELIQARGEAERMASRAEEANRSKSDFLANMSHEIRTPLNAVIGLTHLCLQTDLNQKQHDYLEKVSMSANGLLSLLNDILDFSKIEAGKLTLESTSFSLSQTIDSLVAMLGVTCQEKGLELIIDADPNIPDALIGDPHRLNQVLVNLIGNAIKFTEAGEIIVSVSAHSIVTETTLLELSVTDTGIGMSEQQLDTLFETFTQGDSSTTRKYGGTGLGLSISKRLVEIMGGEISATSQQGKGSRFTFTVRLGLAERSVIEEKGPHHDLQDLHVLVVDDNDNFRRIMEMQIRSLGWDAVSAKNGLKALEILSEKDVGDTPIDLVLIDWKMPGLDGVETCRRIRDLDALSRQPTLIMVTGYDLNEIKQVDEESDLLDGYLMKPIQPSGLFDAIMHAMGRADRWHIQNDPGHDAMSRLSGHHLLLVEDNEINQQVSRELLEQQGIEVTLAEDGKQALERVTAQNFDCVLMDIQMPVMDGYAAARAIREQPKLRTLPIIAMTANAMSGDRDKCLAAGMNDHVAKPVSPDELYATLRRWIGPGARKVAQSSTTRTPTIQTPPSMPSPTTALPPVLSNLPEIPGITMKSGLQNVGGNRDLFFSVLEKFTKNQGGACQEIQTHLQEGAFHGAERRAHALKGVAATIGAGTIADLAGRIEKMAAMKHPDIPAISACIEKAEEALSHTVSGIHAHFGAAKRHEIPSDAGGDDPQPEAVGAEQLAPLFQQAVDYLRIFDSRIEQVVEELALLPHSKAGFEALKAIQKALGAYDFEACLTRFSQWAEAENIPLDDP